MLDFFPEFYPWTPISLSITQEVPTGKFYTSADHRLPRSVKPTRFLLLTDNGLPVDIIQNGAIIKTVRPRSNVEVVELKLSGPPADNMLTIRNGVDEPIHLNIASTYMYTIMDAMSQEIFEYAGRLTENYGERMRSPWASFFIEYLLPWRKTILPTVRAMRILSVKMISNTLFNGSGTQGGVIDYISAFTSSTPVINESWNPPQWEMDLNQPVTSADDATGFEAHVWIPNLCLSKWITFIKLINNVKDYYTLIRVTEGTVVIQNDETEEFQEHRFDTGRNHCSVRGLIDYLGCLDQITAVGTMIFTANIPICAWGLPFDQIVEYPGIGATKHFDSGEEFDGEYGPFDTLYDIDEISDRWVGVSTKRSHDYDGCLDTYPTLSSVPPENTTCCKEGPDTVNLNTMVLSYSIDSSETPNHPVYGGDAAGLLDNPYFNQIW